MGTIKFIESLLFDQLFKKITDGLRKYSEEKLWAYYTEVAYFKRDDKTSSS